MKKIISVILIGIYLLQAEGAQNAPVDANRTTLSAPADDTFGDFAAEGFADEYGSYPTKKSLYDPLEGYNRWMTTFNNDLFDYVLVPVYKGYDFIFPKTIRVSINNIFKNLYYPVSLANNLLQLKFRHALSETGRFIVNTTFGFGGMFDVAYEGLGVEPHVEDFGQTLGYYGVGGGVPIVLPFFGPSNLRDFTGDLLDFYVNPIYYVDARKYNIPRNTYEGWAIVTYKEFNELSLYEEEYKLLRKEAIDFYPFMRDAYEQNRNKEISE